MFPKNRIDNILTLVFDAADGAHLEFLCYGTPNDVFRINPKEITLNNVAPHTVFTALLIDNEEIVTPGEKINGQKKLGRFSFRSDQVIEKHKNTKTYLFNPCNQCHPSCRDYQCFLAKAYGFRIPECRPAFRNELIRVFIFLQ